MWAKSRSVRCITYLAINNDKYYSYVETSTTLTLTRRTILHNQNLPEKNSVMGNYDYNQNRTWSVVR